MWPPSWKNKNPGLLKDIIVITKHGSLENTSTALTKMITFQYYKKKKKKKTITFAKQGLLS